MTGNVKQNVEIGFKNKCQEYIAGQVVIKDNSEEYKRNLESEIMEQLDNMINNLVEDALENGSNEMTEEEVRAFIYEVCEKNYKGIIDRVLAEKGVKNLEVEKVQVRALLEPGDFEPSEKELEQMPDTGLDALLKNENLIVPTADIGNIEVKRFNL